MTHAASSEARLGKGVMFITLQDEIGVANLVIWAALFAKYRRVVLGARMMGGRGRVQREG